MGAVTLVAVGVVLSRGLGLLALPAPAYTGEVDVPTLRDQTDASTGARWLEASSESWDLGEGDDTFSVRLTVQVVQGPRGGMDAAVSVVRVGAGSLWGPSSTFAVQVDGKKLALQRATVPFGGRSVKAGVEESLFADAALSAIERMASARVLAVVVASPGGPRSSELSADFKATLKDLLRALDTAPH